MMVNWEFFDNMTPESACAVVDRLRAGEPVQATRGAQIGTWREAERVLAGFPDGKADEGVDRGRTVAAGAEHRPGARLVGAAAAARSRRRTERATRDQKETQDGRPH